MAVQQIGWTLSTKTGNARPISGHSDIRGRERGRRRGGMDLYTAAELAQREALGGDGGDRHVVDTR